MKRKKRAQRDVNPAMDGWEECLQMIRRCKKKVPPAEPGEKPPLVSRQLDEMEQQVIAMSKAPLITYFQQLERAGVRLPPPGMLDKKELKKQLGQVLQGLARLKIYLGHTDHLSDRELYTELWDGLLHIQVPDVEPNRFTLCFYSMLRVGDELQDGQLYMRYYASQEARRVWAKEFPDKPLPPRTKPPYDRDRYLPKVTEEDLFGEEQLAS